MLELIYLENNEEKSITIYRDQILVVFPNLTHKTNIPLNLSCLGIELTPNNGNFKDSIKDKQLMPFIKENSKAFKRGFVVIQGTSTIINLLKSFESFKKKEILSPYEMIKLDLLTKNLLLEILFKSKNDKKSKEHSMFVFKAISFIEENYYKDILVEQIVQHVNCSKSFLEKSFKTELSCGIKDYINKIRINKAKEFLKDGSYSIKSISKTVGYNSPQIFIRNFKKYTNTNPANYRKQGSIIENNRFFNDNGFYKETKF